ncbi:MAG: HAD-IB family hydrolase [Desulfobacter sp.]|nr:HAD-IB family hydrolase [Desulfobacter sp.]
MNALAFFDVDNTLIQGDTQAMEAWFVLKQKKFAIKPVLCFFPVLAASVLARAGRCSLCRQNEIYLKTYTGRTRKSLAAQGRNLFDQVVSQRFFNHMLARIQAHKQRGDVIVLVSAATRHLLTPLVAVIHPDDIFCTELEFDPQGRCLGQALGKICIQERKKEIALFVAREKTLDLSASYAYSDHHSDIPLLACVGHPHAVKPTPKLKSHALKNNWPVLEKKDL